MHRVDNAPRRYKCRSPGNWDTASTTSWTCALTAADCTRIEPGADVVSAELQAHRRCTPSANLHDPPSLATSGFAIPSDTTPFSSKAPKPRQVTSR